MKCFECDNEAEQNHHPVPKSRGGTKTIPLCQECHDIAHDVKRTSLKYLSVYGLAKLEIEKYAYIFWAITIENKTLFEIRSEQEECFGKTMLPIRNKLKNLLMFDFEDIFELINPIIKTEENQFFSKDILKQDWDLIKSDEVLIEKIRFSKTIDL
jgi:hypothetical protein